jgi:hypothetical protein
VSAVGVKLITFQSFDKFEDAILGVFSTSEAIAESVCVEREMNVDCFSGFCSSFNFMLADRNITTEIKICNILGDGHPSVLWYSMETLVKS